MFKKNAFQRWLSGLTVILLTSLVACSDDKGRPPSDNAKSSGETASETGERWGIAVTLEPDDPCYDFIGIAPNESILQEKRENIEAMGNMEIPEDQMGADSPMAYMAIISRMVKQGNSAEEIQQAVLDKCRLLN